MLSFRAFCVCFLWEMLPLLDFQFSHCYFICGNIHSFFIFTNSYKLWISISLFSYLWASLRFSFYFFFATISHSCLTFLSFRCAATLTFPRSESSTLHEILLHFNPLFYFPRLEFSVSFSVCCGLFLMFFFCFSPSLTAFHIPSLSGFLLPSVYVSMSVSGIFIFHTPAAPLNPFRELLLCLSHSCCIFFFCCCFSFCIFPTHEKVREIVFIIITINQVIYSACLLTYFHLPWCFLNLFGNGNEAAGTN